MNFLQQLNMSGIFKMCKHIIDSCFSLLIVSIHFWLVSLCLFLFLQVGRSVSTGHLLFPSNLCIKLLFSNLLMTAGEVILMRPLQAMEVS